MTIDDIETDYWAHYYTEKPDATEEFEDDEFDLDQVLKDIDNDDWEDITHEVVNGRTED